MRKFSMLGAALAVGLALGTSHAAFAGSYTEVGDAGDIVSGAAQMVTGNAGETVSAIKGMLGSSAGGTTEADAFEIYISSPTKFSASTAGFTPGSNSFDSQLFLFSLDGKGIVANDDDASSGSQSTIPAGNSFTSALTPGYYILLISGNGNSPASTGGLIFPSWTDGVTDPTGVYGPTGPGGALAISSFGGTSNEGGAYSITLTGVTAGPVAAVPEPGTLGLGLLGGLALMAYRRRRGQQ
ncbi:DVUA0089 family protein [Paucibacter sp. R3-3]|uniref:DVUA0089 family protein n=1 Tax=Roseateles agri TaxID=3098619 RepID=A0ABU5DI96_9BURK|nr:DVUA0089 family protein [Paucibacter sp. R3-3]MDY0746016.1 DVUA0089 family protein [Paucibacter sp. R3-3]